MSAPTTPQTASTPTGFVPKITAWVLTLKPVRAYLRYSEHRGAMLADSITYRALFSVFAGLLLLVSVAGLWLRGNPDAWAALLEALDNAIPGITGFINLDSAPAAAGFTIAGIISIVGLVGAAIGAIGSLRTAMRLIADHPNDDVFFLWVLLRNLALAVALGLGLGLAAAVTVLGTAFVGTVAEWLGIASSTPAVGFATWFVAVAATFALDTGVVALAFVLLAGRKASAKALWTGALVGGLGLTVLQQLSGLFVGGATNNPLLATFGSLIALLLWFNLSAQVLLISTSWIVTSIDEEHDRVHERYGARTFPERRVRTSETAVAIAARDLRDAREALEEGQRKAAEKAAKKVGDDTDASAGGDGDLTAAAAPSAAGDRRGP